jgi:hypothetical protein
MTLVEAFKMMQVVEHEEPKDTTEGNGGPDQHVYASIAHFQLCTMELFWKLVIYIDPFSHRLFLYFSLLNVILYSF